MVDHIFSNNEIQIITLLAKGMKNNQIADNLHFSQAYISQTTKQIRIKLDQVINSVYFLQELGILDDTSKLNFSNIYDFMTKKENKKKHSKPVKKRNSVDSHVVDKIITNYKINSDNPIYRETYIQKSSESENDYQNILKFDCAIGLLPIYFSLLIEIQKKNTTFFDVEEFIINTRRLTIVEEIFSSNGIYSNYIIKDIGRSDQMIFESHLLLNKFTNYTSRIFGTLRDQNIIQEFEKKDSEYHVKINALNFENVYRTIKDIFSPHMYPIRDTNENIILRHTNILFDPKIFINRIQLTVKLSRELDLFNFRKPPENGISVNSEKYYRNILSIPLVGTIRSNPNQNVIYILNQYENSKKEELREVDYNLNPIIEQMLTSHRINEIIRECYDTSAVHMSPQYLVKKLIARPLHSSQLFVILMIVFSKEIFRSKQTHNPLSRLYNHIKNKEDWEVFMKRQYTVKSFNS